MQISGLEITDSSVSLLSLKRSGQKIYVSSFAKADLPAGVIENGFLKKPEDLIAAIITLRKKGRPKKVSSPYVILAIPESLVYLTVKSFPNLEEDKLKEAIEINLPDLIPGEPEKIYWGWQETPGEKGKEVLIASVNKDFLGRYLGLMASVGFIPIAIEPFSTAAGRAFSKPQNSIITSLEKNSATVFVFDEGLVRFGQSFLLEGENFEKLAQEVKKVLNFYEAEKRIGSLPIILTGNLASAEVEKYLSDKLKTPVKLGQTQMIFSEGEIKSPAVLGAALRGLIDQKTDTNLSLLPVGTRESYEEKRALRMIGGITNIFAITCLIFMIIFGGFWGLFFWLNGSTDQTLETSSKATVSSDNEIQTVLKDFNPRLAYIKDLLATESPLSPILTSIKNAASTGISFININLPKDGKTMTITGNAQSRDALASFKDALEKTTNFSKVDFSSTSVGEANTSFTVNLTLK